MKEIYVDAVTDKLDMVLNFVNTELGNHGCDVKVQNQVDIAVEEIFANIANYAYAPGTGGVTIRVSVDDTITIEFEDRGIPYNPLERADPDIHQSAEEREVGGLGIYIVKKIMDNVQYNNVDNKNILTLRKDITQAHKQLEE